MPCAIVDNIVVKFLSRIYEHIYNKRIKEWAKFRWYRHHNIDVKGAEFPIMVIERLFSIGSAFVLAAAAILAVAVGYMIWDAINIIAQCIPQIHEQNPLSGLLTDIFGAWAMIRAMHDLLRYSKTWFEPGQTKERQDDTHEGGGGDNSDGDSKPGGNDTGDDDGSTSSPQTESLSNPKSKPEPTARSPRGSKPSPGPTSDRSSRSSSVPSPPDCDPQSSSGTRRQAPETIPKTPPPLRRSTRLTKGRRTTVKWKIHHDYKHQRFPYTSSDLTCMSGLWCFQ